MKDLKSEILRETAEFALENGIYYDFATQSLVENAIEEVLEKHKLKLEFCLNDLLNQTLVLKRSQMPTNSNQIAEYVSNYLPEVYE